MRQRVLTVRWIAPLLVLLWASSALAWHGGTPLNGYSAPQPSGVNGICNPSLEGAILSAPPTGSLCSSGTASATPTGFGPWFWTCQLTTGWFSETCSATPSFSSLFAINTHIGQSGSAYATPSVIVSTLAALKINKVREDVENLNSQASAVATVAAAGVQFEVGAGAGPGTISLSTVESAYATWLSSYASQTFASEGWNEICDSTSGPTYGANAPGYISGAAFGVDFHTYVTGQSTLKSLPLLMFSLGNTANCTQTQLQALGSQAAYANYGNAHIYPQTSGGGGLPPYTNLVSNVPYQMGYPAPGLTNAITEIGYPTMPTIPQGVDANTQGRYTPDMMLDMVLLGYVQPTLYELLDEQNDPTYTSDQYHFGVFNYDGSVKLAATAIENMMGVIGNATVTNTTYATTGLPSVLVNGYGGYTLSLADASANKYLAVWAEPVIWNQTTNAEISPPTATVVASLGATYGTVNTYDVLTATTGSPTATYSNVSSVTLSITDHPVIVQMIAASTTGYILLHQGGDILLHQGGSLLLHE